ncbi:MCRS1 [Cordylochernes scorpioides]|uniref:MCRS1 n=1 Tax=Cordylochernes scorpioides TaxID=51811 RepID=A0ABY6LLC8_9ARAC|nr:MCRS1 [Cordylochernes scorpioides]
MELKLLCREVSSSKSILSWRPAVAAMKQLHPDLAFQIHANALYSEKEEKLLASLPSAMLIMGSPPTLDQLQDLIKAHPEVFLPQRTPKALLHHWTLMKQYSLLPDQAVVPWPASFDQATNISDAEDFLDELDLQDSPDEVVNQEVAQFERKGRREIKQLENELPKWQVIVGSITGVSVPNFDNQTLAVLRGRLVRYLMRSREVPLEPGSELGPLHSCGGILHGFHTPTNMLSQITLGRSTRDNTVDVDLSLEGPSWKVSRRQGVIKLHQGEFYIYNEGKRPIYVDSRPVLTGTKAKMTNNAVIEVGTTLFPLRAP